MEKRRMNKKGQLDTYINYFVGAGAAVLLMAVIVIVLNAFQGTQTAGTAAFSVLNNTQQMFVNLTSQFTTIGTVGGVLALLVIIGLVGVFGYQRIKGRM